MAAAPSNSAKVKGLFLKAMEDGNEAKAEGIVLAAMIYDPNLDLKKRTKADNAGVDFAQSLEDSDYREFERRLDAS